MNLRLIPLLSAAGVLIGVGNLMGVFPSGTELVIWAVLAVAFSIVVARGATRSFFLNGFVAGALAWSLALGIEVALFSRYLANNPHAVASFQQLPDGMSPRLVVAVSGILLALIYGLIVGGLSALTARARRKAPNS